MAEIKCLKNSETKKYIVPTNEWLKPLKPMITSISTKGKIILAKLVDKEKVVVKLTKNVDTRRIRNISRLLNGSTNFPKIYCVFECREDETNFDTNYLNVNGFCSGTTNTDTIITLEIMKLYKHKLSDFSQKLSIESAKLYMLKNVRTNPDILLNISSKIQSFQDILYTLTHI
jgi:hypothetical protein